MHVIIIAPTSKETSGYPLWRLPLFFTAFLDETKRTWDNGCILVKIAYKRKNKFKCVPTRCVTQDQSDISPKWVLNFSYVSSNKLSKQKRYHITSICATFFQMWVFKCFFILRAWINAKSHCLLFTGVSFSYVPSNVFSKRVPKQMHNPTSCICMTLRKSEFSYVSSNGQPQQMYMCNGCIHTIFLQCDFSNVFSNCLHKQMHSCIDCTYNIFHQSEFSCALKASAPAEAKSHWLHLWDFSPGWVFKCFLKSLPHAEA